MPTPSETTAPEPGEPRSVASAISGFTPADARQLRERFDNAAAMAAGDVALFAFLNFAEVQAMTVIPRHGAVRELADAPDRAIGRTTFERKRGDQTLAQYLDDPGARAQGVVVVREGRIVFEQYPGMRPHDYHCWMSTTKTTASLVTRLLVEQDRLALDATLDRYLDWTAGTEWAQVRVRDVLDMQTGMDAIETNATRADPDSVVMRMNLAGSATPWHGRVETMEEVLAGAVRLRPPATAFDYGSPITLFLPMLAEAVTGRRWADVFGDLVWSKLGVEGDMLMGISPQGLALAHGLAQTRLRDLARYGMLYTPSWAHAAREQIVAEAYVREIQTGGHPERYMHGEMGPAMVGYFGGEQPHHNCWQWDAVFTDGDFYKSGLMGQGLYVSPATDSVIAFFGCVYDSAMAGYARAIARSFRTGR